MLYPAYREQMNVQLKGFVGGMQDWARCFEDEYFEGLFFMFELSSKIK
jgi:hypothetical protein